MITDETPVLAILLPAVLFTIFFTKILRHFLTSVRLKYKNSLLRCYQYCYWLPLPVNDRKKFISGFLNYNSW